MTDITNRIVPPPLNWQDFERLCYDLYSHMWRTNDAEMHGRHGQPQAGVDVYGTDRLEGDRFVGVQCKLKEEGALTEKTLRDEIEKAKTFEPPLQVFVIATTAPNDYKIQRVARTISQEHSQKRLFEVRVQGWDTLRQKIADYPEVLRKHFADFAPVDIAAKIVTSIVVTEREGEQTRTEIARLEGHLTAINERFDAGGDPLQVQITQAAKLTDDGSARAAVRALRRIQDEQREKLTGRNLYRLHSGIGFAHVALGELPEAIQEFRKAYDADPDWPSARSSLAVAELLEGERAAAFDHAKQALRDDPSLHQAAAVMIDAAATHMAVADIEALVPVALRDPLDIAMGLSLRARRSGDFEAAEGYIRRVMATHPNDLRVLSTLAEAILEPILSIQGIGLTRLVPPEHQARFDEALDLLQRSWEQLRSRDDVWRYDNVVANLTTTLDVAGREPESGRILEDALRIAPRSTPLLRRHAQKLAQDGNWEGALASIELITGGREPPDELLRNIASCGQVRPKSHLMTHERSTSASGTIGCGRQPPLSGLRPRQHWVRYKLSWTRLSRCPPPRSSCVPSLLACSTRRMTGERGC
jgi:tetratricopeptide (TPR) repeat protein